MLNKISDSDSDSDTSVLSYNKDKLFMCIFNKVYCFRNRHINC